jgi:hypothetical protein
LRSSRVQQNEHEHDGTPDEQAEEAKEQVRRRKEGATVIDWPLAGHEGRRSRRGRSPKRRCFFKPVVATLSTARRS